jgi:hypothetical protein
MAINHIDRATLEAAVVGYEAQRDALMKRNYERGRPQTDLRSSEEAVGERTGNPGRSEGGTLRRIASDMSE